MADILEELKQNKEGKKTQSVRPSGVAAIKHDNGTLTFCCTFQLISFKRILLIKHYYIMGSLILFANIEILMTVL